MKQETPIVISDAAIRIAAIELGTLVTHEFLEDALNSYRNEDYQKYYNRVGKLRKELMVKHGRFLETRTKMGYCLARYGKEIDLCKQKRDKGIKIILQALLDTEHIRLEEFPDLVMVSKTVAERNKMSVLGKLLVSNVNIQLTE